MEEMNRSNYQGLGLRIGLYHAVFILYRTFLQKKESVPVKIVLVRSGKRKTCGQSYSAGYFKRCHPVSSRRIKGLQSQPGHISQLHVIESDDCKF